MFYKPKMRSKYNDKWRAICRERFCLGSFKNDRIPEQISFLDSPRKIKGRRSGSDVRRDEGDCLRKLSPVSAMGVGGCVFCSRLKRGFTRSAQ